MAKLVVSIEVRSIVGPYGSTGPRSEFWVTHIIPPCADGSPNAAALAAFLAKAREIEPEGFDNTTPPPFKIVLRPSGVSEFGRDDEDSQRISEALAQIHHDEAEAPNPLNTADTVGPSEG